MWFALSRIHFLWNLWFQPGILTVSISIFESICSNQIAQGYNSSLNSSIDISIGSEIEFLGGTWENLFLSNPSSPLLTESDNFFSWSIVNEANKIPLISLFIGDLFQESPFDLLCLFVFLTGCQLLSILKQLEFTLDLEELSSILYVSFLSFAAFALLNIFLLKSHNIVPTATHPKAIRPTTEQTTAIKREA